ncbi:hypothetical protein KIW84_022199 [Lathyrus oleraceus]|uniref:Uncharacterized protein n=1 Tax=Pisum sativum TaxID=3888 RepID=A0A9D5B6C2_PEA|nr:hypothetical protein KIW84_022199 [Pisum sativum]
MFIYVWPVSLVRSIERVACNLIWIGDVSKSKTIIVAWKNICISVSEGGLRLKSLVALKEATKLKLGLDYVNSDDPWASLIKSRVLRKNNFINHHIFSSIWYNIKFEIPLICDNSSWIFGNGKSIIFWYDNWCEYLLHLEVKTLSMPNDFLGNSFIIDRSLNFLGANCHIPVSLQLIINNCFIYFDLCSDKRIWNHTTSGELTLRDAYEFKRNLGVCNDWWRSRTENTSGAFAIEPGQINCDWNKFNYGGASLGNPDPTTCGGIARDSDGRCLGDFSNFPGVANSLISEISDAMLTIELPYEKGLWKI